MERTGKYYKAGEERARRVEELFGRIAPRYDLINDLQSFGMHRLWKRRLVRLAEVPPGGRVLDLCCGTGDIVRALARAYPSASLVAGLDFATPMLRISAGRESADERILYLRADALRIPFLDGTIDRVTISYGLRNVADLPGCLAEVRRVLRPGGRFLILDFGKPRNPAVSRAYFAYLRLGVPLFGKLFFGDADTHGYILDSLLRFPSQAETAEMLRGSGFSAVRVEDLLMGAMAIHVARV